MIAFVTAEHRRTSLCVWLFEFPFVLIPFQGCHEEGNDVDKFARVGTSDVGGRFATPGISLEPYSRHCSTHWLVVPTLYTFRVAVVPDIFCDQTHATATVFLGDHGAQKVGTGYAQLSLEQREGISLLLELVLAKCCESPETAGPVVSYLDRMVMIQNYFNVAKNEFHRHNLPAGSSKTDLQVAERGRRVANKARRAAAGAAQQDD
jgi:hypothetical protein